MTGKTPQEYLQDMVNHLDKAIEFTSEGREAFYADEKAQFAVVRLYEVIGEIAKRIPSHIRELETSIDWRQLAGFRDFLAHNYDEILLAFVWEAVEDLPRLRRMVEKVLNDLSSHP